MLKKTARLAALLLSGVLLLSTCSSTTPEQNQPEEPIHMFVDRLTENGRGLVRDVPPVKLTREVPIALEESSKYTRWIATDTGYADIRWLDCRNLNEADLHTLLKSVPNISFNSDTIWPDDLSAGYDPGKIMEQGKNPGLGVRSLHSQGITGEGVSIAIIDQVMFTGHVEYKDNLALYEEIHVLPTEQASMHGSAVSSIAVGKNCGVALGAKLYYWAVNVIKDPTQKSSQYTDDTIAFSSGIAVAIDRILEINDSLPKDQKIRVISIARGFSDLNDEGVQTFLDAVNRAKKAGIFVITTSTYLYYDFIDLETDFAGLGKADYAGDPDELSTYTLGTWEQFAPEAYSKKLLVPMDARTTADFTGSEDYVFYSDGGYSWVAPYLAGLYALAVQVKPDITPKEFWKTALETASERTFKIHTPQTVANAFEAESFAFRHVINPVALIEALRYHL
jgi:hypothetical protein